MSLRLGFIGIPPFTSGGEGWTFLRCLSLPCISGIRLTLKGELAKLACGSPFQSLLLFPQVFMNFLTLCPLWGIMSPVTFGSRSQFYSSSEGSSEFSNYLGCLSFSLALISLFALIRTLGILSICEILKISVYFLFFLFQLRELVCTE